MYKIYRFYSDNRKKKLIKRVSTEEIARLHCSSPNTSGVTKTGVNWFDGYTRS